MFYSLIYFVQMSGSSKYRVDEATIKITRNMSYFI